MPLTVNSKRLRSLKDLHSLKKSPSTWLFCLYCWLKSTSSQAEKRKVQQTPIHTHTHVSAFVLPSAHCSQTNPSSFMSLWGLLLPLIHGGRLSSASTQPISTVSMNIWTGPSTALCLPWEQPVESKSCSLDRWYVCFMKEGEKECDNHVLNAWWNGHRHFHCRSLFWWMFTLYWRNGQTQFWFW